MDFEVFFHKETSTLTYVVYDPTSLDAIIIDPALDYDPQTQQTSTTFIDGIFQWITKKSLNLHASLETHVHADHITGASALKKLVPGLKIGISARIEEVFETFSKDFGLDKSECFKHFDLFLKDFASYSFGSIHLKTLPTPGHTPACTCLKIGNMLFTGDSIFMPDFGTGRCDFPKGSAEELFHSITRVIYGQEDDTIIYVGHDYQPAGRALRFQTTVLEEKQKNIHVTGHTSKDDFVAMRHKRDATLPAPKLLQVSLRANLMAGYMS